MAPDTLTVELALAPRESVTVTVAVFSPGLVTEHVAVDAVPVAHPCHV